VTVYRWVRTFTSEFIDAARSARHATGDRWFVDETYVKVGGRWTYLCRAVDQRGQVIDVLVSKRRDARAAWAFFTRAMRCRPSPVEVTTDRAPVYPRLVDDLVPGARQHLRAVFQQRGGGRSRPAQSQDAADARAHRLLQDLNENQRPEC
jgi:transposase-like protein